MPHRANEDDNESDTEKDNLCESKGCSHGCYVQAVDNVDTAFCSCPVDQKYVLSEDTLCQADPEVVECQESEVTESEPQEIITSITHNLIDSDDLVRIGAYPSEQCMKYAGNVLPTLDTCDSSDNAFLWTATTVEDGVHFTLCSQAVHPRQPRHVICLSSNRVRVVDGKVKGLISLAKVHSRFDLSTDDYAHLHFRYEQGKLKVKGYEDESIHVIIGNRILFNLSLVKDEYIFGSLDVEVE